METIERLLTRHQAAEALGGLSVRMVDKLIAEGELVATHIGRRVVIQPKHVRELLERNVNTSNRTQASGRNRQTDAALRVLAAVKARNENNPEAVVRALRGTSAEVSIRLMEAVELIAHLLRKSGQPEAELVALIESVTNAEHPDP